MDILFKLKNDCVIIYLSEESEFIKPYYIIELINKQFDVVGIKNVIINLNGLLSINSSVIGSILIAKRELNKSYKTDLKLVAENNDIQKTLEILSLLNDPKFIELFTNEDEALESFQDDAK